MEKQNRLKKKSESSPYNVNYGKSNNNSMNYDVLNNYVENNIKFHKNNSNNTNNINNIDNDYNPNEIFGIASAKQYYKTREKVESIECQTCRKICLPDSNFCPRCGGVVISKCSNTIKRRYNKNIQSQKLSVSPSSPVSPLSQKLSHSSTNSSKSKSNKKKKKK